jgi:general secretion pathway protein G
MNRQSGFTIVELLVVIVVIGVLAAITIVSFTGISSRAIVASLQSDLGNTSKSLKMYYTEYGSYPLGNKTTAFNGSLCPTSPNTDTKYCMKLSGSNSIDYYLGTATSFVLRLKNGTTVYKITHNSAPVAFVMPPNTTDNGNDTYTTKVYSTSLQDGYMSYSTCFGGGTTVSTTENTLYAMTLPDVDNGCNNDYRLFQKFDISIIPGGISAATLYDYLYYLDYGWENFDATLYHIPDFGSLEATDYSTTPYSTIGVIATNASSYGYKTMSVSSQVVLDQSSSRQYSAFRIQLPISSNTSTSYGFYSTDNATNKPYLSIIWS